MARIAQLFGRDGRRHDLVVRHDTIDEVPFQALRRRHVAADGEFKCAAVTNASVSNQVRPPSGTRPILAKGTWKKALSPITTRSQTSE
jgi:hypothetical protein